MRGVPARRDGFERRDTPDAEQHRPSAPPISDSSRLSVRSWRMMRTRSAPSARRTAISRRRAGRARQQQIRDVHAGDEQHEPDGAQQHQQRPPSRRADLLFLERNRVDALAAIRSWIGLLETLREPIERAARLRERHPGLQPADRVKDGDVARRVGRIQPQRPPQRRVGDPAGRERLPA